MKFCVNDTFDMAISVRDQLLGWVAELPARLPEKRSNASRCRTKSLGTKSRPTFQIINESPGRARRICGPEGYHTPIRASPKITQDRLDNLLQLLVFSHDHNPLSSALCVKRQFQRATIVFRDACFCTYLFRSHFAWLRILRFFGFTSVIRGEMESTVDKVSGESLTRRVFQHDWLPFPVRLGRRFFLVGASLTLQLSLSVGYQNLRKNLKKRAP